MPVGLHESLHTKVGATHSIIAVPEITFSLCIENFHPPAAVSPLLHPDMAFSCSHYPAKLRSHSRTESEPQTGGSLRYASAPFQRLATSSSAFFAFSRGRREMGGGASGSGRWRV
jgi:hypothetical protein